MGANDIKNEVYWGERCLAFKRLPAFLCGGPMAQLMAREDAASYPLLTGDELQGGAILGKDGLRSDGRAPNEARSPFFSLGTVSRAAGSAYAEVGDTKVLVAIYGPRESQKAQAFSDVGRVNCAVEVATFATARRGKYGKGTEERDYAAMLQKALEGAIDVRAFPKTTVDVFALLLSAGGSDLPVVITCASMALADAGIQMFDLVSSMSVSRVSGGVLLLDAGEAEERAEDGRLHIAFTASRNEIVQLELSGEWSQVHAGEAIDLCIEGCTAVDAYMRSCLREQANLAGSS